MLTFDEIGAMSRDQVVVALMALEKQQDDIARTRVMLLGRLAEAPSQVVEVAVDTPLETLITIDEAARYMDRSPYFLRRNKSLPFLRKIHGKKTLVAKEPLMEWIRAHRRP